MPGISCVYMHCQSKQTKPQKASVGIAMACMANIYNLPESRIFRFSIPANAGASGRRPPEPPTRGAAPWTPLGAYAAPRPPAQLVTPYHLQITCFNKRKPEPCKPLLKKCIYLNEFSRWSPWKCTRSVHDECKLFLDNIQWGFISLAPMN